MEEFVKLLTDYGLKLEFLYKDNPVNLEDDFYYLKKRKKEKNAFEGLTVILGEMMIVVSDYEKLYTKFNVPERFRDVGLIVEKDICVEVRETPWEGPEANMWDISGVDVKKKFIVRTLLGEPAKLGVENNEFKLKMMYKEKETIEEETNRLLKLIKQLEREETVKQGLKALALKINEMLVKEADEPNWYIEYGKQNKVFKEIVDKMGINN